MLDNFIRGGQIFLHNVAMFKQVIGRTVGASLLVAVMITGYVSYQKLEKLDFPAAITYVKAKGHEWISNGAYKFSKNTDNKVILIDAYDKRGLYKRNVNIKVIIKSTKFVKAYKEIEDLAIATLKLTCFISAGFVFLVFLIWSRFGKNAKATKHIKGDIILTAKQVANYLRSNKLASPFTIGDMPLVKDQETRHILVTGMTGSGKTNFFNTLLPQVRQKSQPALVIDQTGEMISRFYDPTAGDIIFNPFDERTCEWDFWREIDKPQRLNSVAASIFCTNKSVDAVWNNLSKQVFIDSVTQLMQKPDRSLKQLYELLATKSLKEASDMLKDTASASLLNPAGDKTAMSIRSNTIAYISWLKVLSENGNKPKIAIKDWVPETLANNRGSWLFISGLAEERALLQPLQSLMLDLTILSLQKLSVNAEHRFWIVTDELASLKKLHMLPQGLAELRKYGGCILAGIQSLNQLFELYGNYQASTMFGQFATKFIFRNDEPSMAKLITEMIGSAEYIENNKNTSYGANEHRDGISYNEQKRQKLLINSSDLSKLANLECFVHLPTPEARIAKINIPYVSAPKITQPGFVETQSNKVILDNSIAQRKEEDFLELNDVLEEINF